MEHGGQGAADHLTAEKSARFTVVMKLRASPAHGVTGSEEVRSEWDELGCLLSTGNHLADMAANQVKLRISKALAASPDVDRDDIGDMTERVYRCIPAWAVEDWENRSVDQGDDEVPYALNLVVLQVRPAEPTSREQDMELPQAMIDGTINLMDETLADKLEPLFAKYENDPTMMDLLNRAANAYADAVLPVARKALALHGERSPQATSGS